MELVAETVDTLLGTGLLFIASRTTKGRVEMIVIECLFERVRLHDLRMLFGTMGDGIDVLRNAVGIDPDDELETDLLCHAITELNHFMELPSCIDMHQREGNLARIEGLLGQTKHDG